MKIVRFETAYTPPSYGWIDQDRVGVIRGDPFGEFRRYDPEFSLSELKLLVPCQPSKIIAVGRNYEEHIREMNQTPPEIPLLFLKPPSTLLRSGDPIVLPPQSERVEHEAELAVVIKKKSRWLRPESVRDAIFGYTIANDVTARDLQQRDGQWTRAKGFDTFCPLGPWIETEFDPSDALITCRVNEVLRQMTSTRDMLFNIEQLILYASSIMTLLPGDVILTGTPAGVGKLNPGDVVSIFIDGIGSLVNPVIAGKPYAVEEA
ncbi:MAG: fumarylacetoacetate hydrolase family protein [Chloroflexi bacterium]|jgi:2-keto-4-pentenoate hydratase/2-oxohepta-3-ene-1,7-dioic acid hydratase in catechol pathway|nr:fumarylacetoacetate hydrolase family protein [Anaerolineaceae bacterium]NLI44186.1 fumarylacetoacetate hydrolase family protein [Chloroflexota bacterium]HOE35434.1 fumarylacetoacetate hydrolase family protein [Anaerolineaceae bacterium]HOT24903.1 fumarylacetoacetate hydrolase family protein [Anaerolineaceae bacterium]HQH57496.1 fumarylacetoacetate hydrolase family protein [Anaerolineaceae bacterium]